MNKYLFKTVISQFQLELSGDHGVRHWERVEKLGLYLSQNKDVDKEIISLFALLHDSKRENEFNDLKHGLRAAQFTKKLYNLKKLSIHPEQLNKLMYACEHHSNKHAQSNDLTIRICWDSDRLDLVRLDIEPDKLYLYTKEAKKLDSLLYALQLLKEYPKNGSEILIKP